MHFAPAAALIAFVLSTRDERRIGGSCYRRNHESFCNHPGISSLSFSSSSSAKQDGDGGEKYSRLLDWVKTQEGSTVSSAVDLRPSTLGGGYGAFVKKPVAKDDVLFAIPRSACITLADAISDPDVGEVFAKVVEKAGPGGNTVVMAGFMAKERLQSLEHSRRTSTSSRNDEDAAATDTSASIPPDSRFGPYLATLPWERGVNNQEHAMYWTQDDVDKFLSGTMCYDEVNELRQEVDLAIDVLDKILGKSIREMRGELQKDESSGFKWPWEIAQKTAAELDAEEGPVEGLPQAIKGAFVSLLTRAFQDDDVNEDDSYTIESADEEKLVPLLDLLQHSDEPNIRHAMRKTDGTVEVRARRDLEAGEELLNQYRSEEEVTMPYHRFFTRFGFVPGIQESMLNLLRDRSPIFFAQKAEI